MRIPSRRVALTALGLVALAAGCSKARPVTDGTRRCETWKEQIQPAFTERCAGCHGGATPAAGYDLSSYLGVLATGAGGQPRVTAGDPSSPLLSWLDPASTDARHGELSDLLPTVRHWVVDCRLAYTGSPIHPPGILNPADPDEFHGAIARSYGYDLPFCANCHGEDFSGGKAGVSCLTCHPQTPTACGTCHGLPPENGAHAAHVQGSFLNRPLDCSECHIKPDRYDAPGHIGELPADITFGALAGLTPRPAERTGPPTYDTASASCTNVYCHGGAFDDTHATRKPPRWEAGTGPLTCDSCHGFPPEGHAQAECNRCHGQVVNALRQIINPALHLDGVVELGDGSGTCSACHGDSTSPAPPRDLSGNTAPQALGVGAHRSHLQALHRLRGPLACGDCHLVPSQVTSPGHLDSELPAEVFPGGSAFGGPAAADGASPSWDRAAGTCGSVYCHGGGTKLAADTSPGINRQPLWTAVNTGQASCGSCHGIPPTDGVHLIAFPLTQCAICHPSTVDAYGNILVSGPPGAETSTHINGVIDVR